MLPNVVFARVVFAALCFVVHIPPPPPLSPKDKHKALAPEQNTTPLTPFVDTFKRSYFFVRGFEHHAVERVKAILLSAVEARVCVCVCVCVCAFVCVLAVCDSYVRVLAWNTLLKG